MQDFLCEEETKNKDVEAEYEQKMEENAKKTELYKSLQEELKKLKGELFDMRPRRDYRGGEETEESVERDDSAKKTDGEFCKNTLKIKRIKDLDKITKLMKLINEIES